MALGRMAGERLSLLSLSLFSLSGLSLLSLSGLSLLSLSIVSLSDPLPLSEGPLGEREEGVCGRLPEGEKVVRELHDIRASLCGHHPNYRRRHPHCAMEGILWIEGA